MIAQIVGVALIAAAALGSRVSGHLRSGAARVALLVVGISAVAWGQTTYQVRSRRMEPGQNYSRPAAPADLTISVALL